ncbi:DUF3000 domain-containing protein [Corynebacterium sp. sy039]|uniref:DUF3000 domain-containing protein n=1 Tax=Corynebacterium sp. sy039 TaxID=2599641 RepID=UPI0011B391BB|nr:DUF3000 domain-containing protein [Corynebacterium sp. sy039]QDZ42722.1 DUF3000 domain-containing protein [Corynebacterium sp. sy039]
MTESRATSSIVPRLAQPVESENTPDEFLRATESMHHAHLRPEISLSTIRPPRKLATFSHAIGLEITKQSAEIESHPDEGNEGDAFGRLILLYDPRSEDTWEGSMRLVAYIQADMDDSVANDPLLPDVAWQWLTESLEQTQAPFSNLGGTVTSTTSVRFGDIGGLPRAYQVEMRASWTPAEENLENHVRAFAEVLANVAGLPPEGVTVLGA